MEDYTKDPQFLLYGKDIKRNPSTLAELSQIIHQKQTFLKSRKDYQRPPFPKDQKVLSFSQQYSTFTYLWAVQLAFCG